MPREIFGHVTDPPASLGSRKWYTVPLSLAAHVFAILPLVLVPLLAADMLPLPRESTTMLIVAPPAPPEPAAPMKPVRPATRREEHMGAPIEAPAGITPEPDFDSSTFTDVGKGLDPGVLGTDVVIGRGEPVAPPSPPKASEPLHVGGHVKAPLKVRDASPVYPAIAQAARMQGMVILEAVIGVDGHVQNVRVLRSIPLLDQAALDAVRQWEYTPTLLNGTPVPVIMTITVTFTLNK